MDSEHLRTGVKSLIEAHPEVGEILERYDIGCVRCMVGTCALEDVVKIHTLAPQDEAEMMAQIERALDPQRSAAPAPPPTAAAARREITHSPPVRKLVEEHKWIKRLLALIPELVRRTRAAGEIDRETAVGALDFIRGYADRFHHLKEEDILFDYTDRDAEIIRVMLQDHDRARGLVRAAAQAIADGDRAALCDSLVAYRDLLTEHITREDEILYPYIDRGLTTSQVGEVFRRFTEAESALEQGIPQRYERLITELEHHCQPQEEEQCQTPIADVPVAE